MRVQIIRLWLIAAVLATAAVACDDDPTVDLRVDEVAATTTATATAPSPARSPLPAMSPLPRPSASPSLRPSASPPSGRVDGTISPLNAGSTAPFTVKANPDPPSGTAVLTDVRIGAHPEEGGWDRIVFEFRGVRPAGSVAYVSDVAACGSGAPVSLPGRAVLAVRFTGAAAHDDAGRPTITRAALPGPGAAILEARQTCDFEGEVAWAVGVAGAQRFKVTLPDSPQRVVIDIKR